MINWFLSLNIYFQLGLTFATGFILGILLMTIFITTALVIVIVGLFTYNAIKFQRLLRLKKGKHEGKRRVHKFRTNHIEIELEEEVMFNVDGEKIVDKKFVIDVLPKAITIFNDNDFVEEIMN